MGQAYLLPKRKTCDKCGGILTYEPLYLYIYNNQPYMFCDPNKKRCFFEWHQILRSPDNLRPKGLL